MTNKFRQIEPLEMEGLQNSARPVQVGLDGGYRGDVSPREVPMGSSPELGDVRFERRAIRKDFGWTAIGGAATNPVLIILEHKYIDGGETFQRLIRVWRNGAGNAVLEVWAGDSWAEVDVSAEVINDEYLSGISALGCAYFADGLQVLEWCEVLEKTAQEDDFPSGNELTVVDQVVVATISPGSADPLEYTVHYDVTVNSSPNQDTVIELEFFHGLVSLGTVEHGVSRFETFPFTLADQEFKFNRAIADLDTVRIKVKSATGGGSTSELDNVITPSGGDPEFEGDKTPAEIPANNDKYTYHFSTSGGPTTVGFYYNRGTGWVLAAQQEFTDGGFSFDVTIPDFVEVGAQFGMGALAGGMIGDTQVGWNRTNADFEVHGHNKATQGDDPAGVTYETPGAVISSFEKIDPGPGGRFLQFFARRLVVLRDFGDTQALTWSMDGILNDFSGAGSGEIILVEARSDAVDDLMGTAVLGSNFMALFRKRSIWRVFETGNELLSLGAVSWIENLGTSSPFSIQEVPGGAIFLGHNLMVYYITEQGVQPIGSPIHQDLIEVLTGNLDKVDSGWDAAFQEYYMGIPESAEEGVGITKVWIFDMGRFNRQQQLVWRTRPMTVQRFGSSSAVAEPAPVTSGTVVEVQPGVFIGASDFSEIDVQEGLPAEITAIGVGGSCFTSFGIVDGGIGVGHYFRMGGAGSTNCFQAFYLNSFLGLEIDEGELLARIWVEMHPIGATGNGLEPCFRVRAGPGFDGIGVRTVNAGDFEFYWGSNSGVTSLGDITPVERPNGDWVWIRLRRDFSAGTSYRLRGKAWYDDVEDEPVGWEIDQVINTGVGGDPSEALGWGGPQLSLVNGVDASDQHRISYFSFSSDPDAAPPPKSVSEL